MADVQPLIASKLEPPLSGPVVVSRPRLFERLNAAVHARLTFLTCPAGWGKTQLLASWIESGSVPFRTAWVTLEAAENDPVRFWNYVLAALRGAVPPDQAKALRELSGALVSTSDWRVFVAMLVNALAELGDPVILVLDDADVLRERDVLEQFEYLALHGPTTLRIVVTGRTLPGLSPETAKAVGQASVFRPSTLAFDADETANLLSAYDISLDIDAEERLRQKTQGWISGLQMAVLTAREAPDASASLSHFAGDEPLVADYLLTEVLSNQKPVVQRFLLRTSIVPSVTPELARALTGRKDAQQILETLEQKNLFTAFTSPARDEFSYSPVFRAFLISHLTESDPGDLTRLHLIASKWFSAEGRVVESIEHAILARDRLNVLTTFGEHWLSLYLDREFGTLQRLLNSMDPEMTRQSPDIVAVQALVHLADAEGANGSRRYSSFSLASSDGGRETSSLVAAACLFELRSAQTAVDLPRARRAWERLAEFPGINDVRLADDLRAQALLHLSATEFSAGDWKASETHAEEAMYLARRTGREYVELGCLSQLGQLASGKNQLTKAAQLAREALAIAETRGWTHTSEAAGSWGILAWVHQLRGELDDADQCLDRAEDAARRDLPWINAVVHCDQGLVLSLRGDNGAALAALREAAEALEKVQERFVFWTFICAERVRMLSAMGDATAAREVFAEIESIEPRTMQIILASAQLCLDAGKDDEALEVLEPALNGLAEGPHEDRIQALLMAAVAHHRRGRVPLVRKNLHAALELGRREGYRQPFMRLDSWVAPLLRNHVAQPGTGPTSAYVESILALLSGDARPVVGFSVEALSDREIEVLGHLPDLMTVPELAAELFISVNTVKAHLKSIYRKLGAPNRRSAVKIARSQGLL